MERIVSVLKTILSALGVAIAVIAAIFGAGWAKKKLEARGAKKQHDAQKDLADRTEEAIAESDHQTDRKADEQLDEIDREQEVIDREHEERLSRDPSHREVKDLIARSKE